jgi:hypothetical protein
MDTIQLRREGALEGGARFAPGLISREDGQLGDEVRVPHHAKDRRHEDVRRREGPGDVVAVAQPVGQGPKAQTKEVDDSRPASRSAMYCTRAPDSNSETSRDAGFFERPARAQVSHETAYQRGRLGLLPARGCDVGEPHRGGCAHGRFRNLK